MEMARPFSKLPGLVCVLIVINLFTAHLFAALLFAAHAHAETVRMTTLRWQPYVGETLPGGGLCTALARQALAASAFQLDAVFLPWTEALEQAGHPDFVGIFPAYAEEVPKGFLAVELGITTPLQIAQHKGRPQAIQSLADLAGKIVGVVQGYGNTVEFDAMLAAGRFRTVAADDDVGNLLNLVQGRVDVAMIDRHVFIYLTRQDRQLTEHQTELVLAPFIVERKQLFAAFQNNLAGQRAKLAFERGISRIDSETVYRTYISSLPK
jgi:polar amino acid transport system substrate-binding protein